MPSTRDAVLLRARELLGQADVADLLRFLTPAALAAGRPWSATSVRNAFRGASAGLDRGVLARALIAEGLDAQRRAGESAVAGFGRVADALRAGTGLAVVLEQVLRHLADFSPGAHDDAGVDPAADQRAYHVALAVADTDRAVAALLRGQRRAQIELYESMYADLLNAFGRELQPGVELADLADAIYILLDGFLVSSRAAPGAAQGIVLDAVLVLFEGLSRPIGSGRDDVRGRLEAGRAARPSPPR